MPLEIQVISETKGSNHGGRCLIKEADSFLPTPFYVKHCSGTRIKRDESWLNYQHQPIYEAITAEMALALGLSTPNFYVIQNLMMDVFFIRAGEQKCDLKPGYPFYFASELLMLPEDEDLKRAGELIKEEEFHRDLLMISDIVGRKQNYFYDSFSDSVIYLDLGCSFVHAHECVIELKNHHKPPLKKKDLKRGRSMFEKYRIKIKNKKTSEIPLLDFINLPYEMEILTLNPRGKIRLDQLISDVELDEIVGRIAAGLYHNNVLKRNRDNPFLVRL